MTLSPTVTDVIAELSGTQPGSALAELRAQRPEAMTHAQGSYAALFDPIEVRGLRRSERLAVALRVATLHDATAAAAHYRRRLIALATDTNIIAAAEGATGTHPGSPRLPQSGLQQPLSQCLFPHLESVLGEFFRGQRWPLVMPLPRLLLLAKQLHRPCFHGLRQPPVRALPP